MPEIDVQLHVADPWAAGFTVARALLRAGRSYEEAVKLFQPYTHIQDPNPQTRSALRRLIREARMQNRRAYVFVNNRLEGNAPETIAAIIEEELP
jgi:hypothetical protein